MNNTGLGDQKDRQKKHIKHPSGTCSSGRKSSPQERPELLTPVANTMT